MLPCALVACTLLTPTLLPVPGVPLLSSPMEGYETGLGFSYVCTSSISLRQSAVP